MESRWDSPRFIRATILKLCAPAARTWSAVTCHRFCRFGDLSPKRGRVQRPGRVRRLPAFDGDKSPAKSADKSAHSKVVAPLPRRVHSCPFVASLMEAWLKKLGIGAVNPGVFDGTWRGGGAVVDSVSPIHGEVIARVR